MKGKLKVLGPGGDREVVWEGNDAQRAEAEKLFNDAIEKGGTPFQMDADNKGHRVDRRDLPEDGTTVIAPRLVGG